MYGPGPRAQALRGIQAHRDTHAHTLGTFTPILYVWAWAQVLRDVHAHTLGAFSPMLYIWAWVQGLGP